LIVTGISTANGWKKEQVERRADEIARVTAAFGFDHVFKLDFPTTQLDRIPIGEVRGAEALDLLKAWGTGHPGGVGTIHAGSALGALRRMEQLIQEAVVTVPRALIAETIDLIAVLAGRGADRRLAELAAVSGLNADGDYALEEPVLVSTGDRP
jgi:Flp pilus assembly CpaF family ATPase